MKAYLSHVASAAAGLLLACSGAMAGVSLDFETAGQYSGNFRVWTGSGVSQTVSQTSLGAANDYVKIDRTTGGGTSVVALYDKTPANTTDAWDTTAGTITVSLDVMASSTTTSSSFGVVFINPTTSGTNKNVMALFNVNANGVLDRLRIFQNNPLDGSAAGTQYGTTNDLDVVSPGTPVTMTVSYAPTTGTITANVGSLSNSYTLNAADRTAIGSNLGVAFRVNDADMGSAYASFDNVSIVPEPASVGLLGLTSLSLLTRRRA